MTRYNYIPIFSTEDIAIDKNQYNNYTETVCLANWSMNHKYITFYLNAFKWAFKNRLTYALYRKLINCMTHEVLHGVIQKIMEQDKWSGDFNPEWPMENGMDTDYKRVLKRLEK